MRAWRVGGAGEPLDVLGLVDGEVPDPGPGQARVRVRAAALGLPDLLMCRGEYPLTPALPFTPGQEVAGVVTATGPGVDMDLGERRMGITAFQAGHGGFAEESVVLADFSFRIEDAMDDTEAAAFMIPYHTAWIGLVQRARLQPGESLLVTGGAGGTGSAAIQLGAALGARVIATARGPGRTNSCSELGAVEAIDTSQGDFVARVRELTGGRGVDVAFDPVGGDTFRHSSRVMAPEGRLLVIGFASGTFAQLDTQHLLTRNYSVMGAIPTFYPLDQRQAMHAGLMKLLEAGEIRPLVAATFPFDELPAALATVAARSVVGKVVLTV